MNLLTRCCFLETGGKGECPDYQEAKSGQSRCYYFRDDGTEHCDKLKRGKYGEQKSFGFDTIQK